MSLTIQIAVDLEKRLQLLADKEGLDINELVVELLEKGVENKSVSREDELLQNISIGLSPEQWEKYYALIDKRQNYTISEMELQELITITDKIEELNVIRIQNLIELAKIRNTTLDDLMESLDLKTADYV